MGNARILVLLAAAISLASCAGEDRNPQFAGLDPTGSFEAVFESVDDTSSEVVIYDTSSGETLYRTTQAEDQLLFDRFNRFSIWNDDSELVVYYSDMGAFVVSRDASQQWQAEAVRQMGEGCLDLSSLDLDAHQRDRLQRAAC